MINIFYTGCINSNNIGDDILFPIFIFLLYDILKNHNIDINLEIDKSLNLHNIKNSIIGVIGGGSLLHPVELSYTMPIINFNPKYKLLFGTGISDAPTFKMDDCSQKMLFEKNFEQMTFPFNDIMKKNIDIIQNNVQFGGLRGPLDVFICKKYIPNFKHNFIYDPGMLANIFYKHNFNKNENIIKKKTIGINLLIINDNVFNSYYVNSITDTNKQYLDTIEEFINYALYNDYSVKLLPFGAGEISIHKTMMNKFGQNDDLILIDDISFPNLLNEIKSCHLIIGSRLHASILSAGMGIPFINIAYGYKCVNFCKSVELDEFCILRHLINLKTLKEKLANIEDSYIEILSKLQKHILNAYDLHSKELLNILNDILDFNSKMLTIRYNIFNNIFGIISIS